MVTGGRQGSRFVSILSKIVLTVWWLYCADDEGDGGCCCGGDDERQRSRRRDDCVRTDATAVAAQQPLSGGAARHRGSRRLYATSPPPPQTVAPSTPLVLHQRRPCTIYNAYVRVLYWGDFFPHFFFDRLWIVFFSFNTPTKFLTSFKRLHERFRTYFLFSLPPIYRLLTHFLTLSHSPFSFYLPPSVYLSLYLHINTSLGSLHIVNDV